MNRNCPYSSPKLDLLDRDFKSTAKTKFKKLKGSMRIMFHQMENTNTEISIIKKEPNRNFRVEKYKNLNKKFAEGAQQQILIDKESVNLKTV